jgi:hypothetical protein
LNIPPPDGVPRHGPCQQWVELASADLEQDVTGLRKEVMRLDHRLDRLDERLAGLERRRAAPKG